MILSTTLLVMLWVVTLVRLPTLRRDRRQRALWATIAVVTLIKTVSYRPVADSLHEPTLPHLLGVVFALCLLRFITLVTGRRGGLWQYLLCVAVLAALGTLAAVSGGIGTSVEALSGRLAPSAVAYWVVLEAYLGTVLLTASLLFGRVARGAPRGLPRLGLWAISAGTALVALFAAAKTTLIVAHGLGTTIDFALFAPIGDTVQATGALLAVAGSLVPASRRLRATLRAYRSLLAMRPLWTAMRDAFPEVILFTPRRAVVELAGADDVDLRLYRRVIEIRDGMLALRGYLPEKPEEPPSSTTTIPQPLYAASPAPQPQTGRTRAIARRPVPQPQAGRPQASGSDSPAYPQTDPAENEARAIVLALRRHAAGESLAARPVSWARVGPEMADEVEWLSRVSTAYRRLRKEPG